MPDLIIDGRPVSVPKGTMVIEAAETLGIMIPRFCWHKALGAAGACRLCAVMFTDGPVKGLEMSCMTPAADGMVVDTGHPEAVAFRRRIIELLMVNHPHDCPVCDEGGHCLLQDETVSGNHALRRYPGRKRTYADQDLGPFIQHEMNRCIHCYRCARFYQEYCGYRDFGPMQNANRVYFGRFADGPLENPFAGNLADLCPTGTLTDKTARYTSRRWDCQRAPSVCPHCGLGCNTVALSRYREVVRVEARENLAVNGSFICDRGRFSHGYETRPDRPRRAIANGEPTSVDAAVGEAAKRLRAVADRHGPAAVAVAGSLRSTLETQAALIALARAAGWTGPAFFPNAGEHAAARRALAALSPRRALSLSELSRADAVLVLGVSPLCDAPMLALALRQAARAEAKIFVADPRPVSLPLPFVHLPAHSRQLPTVMGIAAGPAEAAQAAIQKRLPLAPELWPALEQAAAAMAAAKRPALVFAPALAAALPDDDRFGLFPVLPRAGSAGAALLASPDAPGLDALAEGVEAGRIKALVVAEADLDALCPALARRLDALEALVVCDCLPTRAAGAAHVFLPTATLNESGGTLANAEGRLQRAEPVQAPGEPVRRDGGGGHPPRAYDHPLPGTDPRPGARLCAALAAALSLDLPDAPLGVLARANPALAGIDFAALPPQGARPDLPALAVPPDAPSPLPSGEGLTVVFDHGLFGDDELGRFDGRAWAAAPQGTPAVSLHADDAAAYGLADGETAMAECGDRLVPVLVRVGRDVVRGMLVATARPELAGLPPTLGPCGLRRK